VLWDVGSDDPVRTFDHGHDLSEIALTADGTRLLTASADSAKEWDVGSGQLLFTIAGEHLRGRFDRGGRRLALWSPDGVVRVHDARTGARLGVFGRDATAVDLNTDGSRLVTGGRDGRVMLWDVKTRRTSASWDGHHAMVLSVHWPSDARIVSSGADGTVRLWNAATGATTVTVGHRAGPLFAEVNADGSRVATRGLERSVRLWTRDGDLLGVLEGPAAHIIRFGRSGDLLVTWAEGKARVWNTTGRPIETPAKHTIDADSPWLSAVLSDDGMLAGASDRHGISKVYDARTGRDLFTVQETDYDVGFSHDGALFFTADAIKRVTRVWDWRSEKLLTEIEGAPEHFTWQLQYETRTPEEMARLVERQVPWRLEGGRLVETRTR
jgi:WD40 repeat protein